MEKFDIFEGFIRYYGSAYLVVDKTRGLCTGIADKYFNAEKQVVLIFNPMTQPPWSYENECLACTLVFEGNRTSVLISNDAVVATYSIFDEKIQGQAYFPKELDAIFAENRSQSMPPIPTDSSEKTGEEKPKIRKLFPR
ncbi:hypothetical protein [Chrysiogenes arsenatis]|uniref:hypothetical protein n=1 Tax=Chrysiogenes arsenatis TaxID=309797 RepID=UPI000411D16C|nr:hypothetical protein [Chrysiogenes arsenatis]